MTFVPFATQTFSVGLVAASIPHCEDGPQTILPSPLAQPATLLKKTAGAPLFARTFVDANSTPARTKMSSVSRKMRMDPSIVPDISTSSAREPSDKTAEPITNTVASAMDFTNFFIRFPIEDRVRQHEPNAQNLIRLSAMDYVFSCVCSVTCSFKR